MRLLCGGTLAYWLSHIINPAFVTIAVMIVLFIPVFLSDYYSVQIVKTETSKPVRPPARLTHQPTFNPTTNKLEALGKHSTTEILAEGLTAVEAESDQTSNHKAILTK
jgi:hypothetical protein